MHLDSETWDEFATSVIWLPFHFLKFCLCWKIQSADRTARDRPRCGRPSMLPLLNMRQLTPRESRWCRGCKAVFCKRAKTSRNSERPLIAKLLLFKTISLSCLTKGQRNNASKDYIPTRKFIHSFIQLVSFCLCLSLFASPFALLSVDSCCDLNIINGFSGSA